MTDIILEVFRAVVLLGIVIFLCYSGRNKFEQFRQGWNFIIYGFGLLLFGSVLDISDNFESLNQYIIIGDTDTEAFLEKFVGFLGGFVFLAVGLFKWIPGVQNLSDLVDVQTRNLKETNIKLSTEISERNRAEKMKHEFTATVSHELRTPLTSIKGSLALIRSGSTGKIPEKTQALLKIACDNSQRLETLINDLLDMEKITAGKIDYNMLPMSIDALIEEAIQANKGYADQYNVTFVTDIRNLEDTIILGDKNRLMQVLSNLMSNAAKYSPIHDQIEITHACNDNTVRIAIKDNGPGIPENFKDRIFEDFTQVDSSDIRQRGGTGLGLSIAMAIINDHHGAIGVESQVGNGSTFYFTLPILE